MINRIKNILEHLHGIASWRINEVEKTSHELFFIKKKLDLNRCKEVHIYTVTVYVDIMDGDQMYFGQSSTEIAPTMTDDEVRAILNDTKLAASYVKNKPYLLAKPSDKEVQRVSNKFLEGPLMAWMPKLTKAVYQTDIYAVGGINSVEIFLNLAKKRIMNSEGIDVVFENYSGMIEVVTEWNDGKEPVEIFGIMDFGDYQPKSISSRVKEMIEESKARAHAGKTPSLTNINVLLGGEAVKDFLMYYVNKTTANAIYEETSDFKIGQKIQGNEVEGDLLTIDLLPILEGSGKSAPYDVDGQLLSSVKLIEEGVLKTYHGALQFSSYLDIEPTGRLLNVKVQAGSVGIDEMKKEPYIELLSFSDFLMDNVTGDFGGEIRLARYYDGNQVYDVTGGSISGNIKDVQGNMRLSKELIQYNNYVGPKRIRLKGVEVTGI